MDKISIIIPVYNVELYIRRCLDSILNQTYANLEVICINDGSTDNSGSICDEYSAKDERVRVFHKANAGAYSARNVGLINATGKYIGFVDPDDWVEPDMFETLHSLIKKYNTSFSAAGFFFDTDTESTSAILQEIVPQGVLNQRELLQNTYTSPYYSGLMICIWNKLYSLEFISNNNLSFDESAKSGMDMLFSCRVMLCDNCTGTYLPKPLYHYYQRDASDSKTDSFEYNVKRLNIKRACVEMIDARGYWDINGWAKRDYCYHASVYLESALKTGNMEHIAFMKNEMKRYLAQYLELNRDYPDRLERFNRLLLVEPE